jgi:predicted  nucleic acid-binding Zn-ribbon protein
MDKFILDRLEELEFMQGSTGKLLKECKHFIEHLTADVVNLRDENKALHEQVERLKDSEKYYITRAKEAEKKLKTNKKRVKK